MVAALRSETVFLAANDDAVDRGRWSQLAISLTRSIPKQQDAMAQAEIDRRRGLGESDQDIFLDAVQKGEIEIVGAFIRNPSEGFDINMADSMGQNALHRAMSLLGHYAVNPGDMSEQEARSFGKERIMDLVKLLIEDGKIDKAKLDNAGTSAWSIAAQYSKIPEMQEVASYLKEQLNAEAGTAVENKDKDRLDQLMAAGADERDIEGAEEDAQGMQAGPLGPDTQIPENDTRTTQEIIDGSKVFRQLSQSDRQALLDFIGKDVTDERHKVYLAVAVLNHIEHFDSNGEVIILAGDGRIDGWDRADRTDSDAKADGGSEASRFKDFLENGWGTLKGDSKPNGYPPQFEHAPELSVPEGKSAEEILEKSELFQNLSYNDKAALWNRVGNFEEDPAAAQRVIEVLNHIELYTAEGKRVTGRNVGNGKIDGWDRKSRNDPGAKAEGGSEAARFRDFITHGWTTLKIDTSDIQKLVDDLHANFTYEKLQKLVAHIQMQARDQILRMSVLPENRHDILANPDDYDDATRAAAYLELQKMRDLLQTNPSMHTYEAAYLYAADEAETDYTPSSNVKMLTEHIEHNMKKLLSDDVSAWISEHLGMAAKKIVALDDALKADVRDLIDRIVSGGLGVEEALEADAGVIENLQDHYFLLSTLNTAAGDPEKDHIENLEVDIKDLPSFDKIITAYDEEAASPDVLQRLVDGGMSLEDAILELQSRASLFGVYGSPVDDIADNVNHNIQTYLFNTANGEDLQGIILDEEGDLDEERLRAVIESIAADDPDHPMFFNAEGEQLAAAQVAAGMRSIWDTMRSTGKWNHSTKKFEGMSQILDPDHPINKSYGGGVMHAFSAFLAAGCLIAKGAGDPSPQNIVSGLASGLQLLGLTGEAIALSSRTERDKVTRLERWRERWNNRDAGKGRGMPLSERDAKAYMGHFTNISRMVSVAGGTMVLGASIAAGVQSARRGDSTEAALYIISGIANAATVPFSTYQSIRPYFGNPAHVIKNAPLWAGRLGAVLNGAASIAFLVVSSILLILQVKKEKDYVAQYLPTLEKYQINGGYDPAYEYLRIPTIPEEQWYPWRNEKA